MHLRIPVFLALFSLISASALAADDSFVGKWKLNSDKSQFAGLEYKIEDAGGGKYRLAFGDDVETLPFDGKDHPTKYGNTWAITQTGPNKWKWTRKTRWQSHRRFRLDCFRGWTNLQLQPREHAAGRIDLSRGAEVQTD